MIEGMTPPTGVLVKVFLEKALSHETFSQEVLSEDIEEEESVQPLANLVYDHDSESLTRRLVAQEAERLGWSPRGRRFDPRLLLAECPERDASP
ncbi:unnamed protein product [Boreogadus saida]